MIDKEELREFIKEVIKDELDIVIEHDAATYHEHAKIRVGVWLGQNEIAYSETRVYE